MHLCTDTVISLYRGRFYARCAKNSSLYREYRYIGVLSHTFYCNFCRDIAYLSLYRGYRYIEDRYIGVPRGRDVLGTLSNDDDDRSENVAKKMNLSSFKLNRVYLDPIKCQMQATFPGVEFLRILFRFKKRKEDSSSYVHVLHKTSNWEVSRRSRAVDVKEMY